MRGLSHAYREKYGSFLISIDYQLKKKTEPRSSNVQFIAEDNMQKAHLPLTPSIAAFTTGLAAIPYTS